MSNHLCNRDARTYRSKKRVGPYFFWFTFFIFGVGLVIELNCLLSHFPFFNIREEWEIREKSWRLIAQHRRLYCLPHCVPLMVSGCCWEIFGPMKEVPPLSRIFFHCRCPIVCAGTVWKRSNKVVCVIQLCRFMNREGVNVSLIGLLYYSYPYTV